MKDIIEKIIVSICGLLILICFLPKHAESAVMQDPIPCNTDTSLTPSPAHPLIHSSTHPLTPSPSHSPSPSPSPSPRIVAYNGRPFSYKKAFADRNDKHLAAAAKIGLKVGPANRAAAEKMSGQLRLIQSTPNYIVEELTHSLPYLVPTAAARLDSIGAEFADILARNGLPHHRFRVTSVLRSQEDIRRLQRCNSNSIPNSAHNYGTTFDIAYWHYEKVTQTTDSITDDNLKLVLAQTLLNQQRAGHIYVKYEAKQSCFHVTVRN